MPFFLRAVWGTRCLQDSSCCGAVASLSVFCIRQSCLSRQVCNSMFWADLPSCYGLRTVLLCSGKERKKCCLPIARDLCDVVGSDIPLALQVVCTSTMVLGSRALVVKQATVSRLASIEGLVVMDMLCLDNMCMLTRNTMTVESKLS